MALTVLIVDDSLAVRELLKDQLARAGMQVVAEAGSGLEAVELFRQHRPDLVLMDLVLPFQNGVEAAREIRRLEPRTRIVAISGLSQPGVMAAAEGAGMQGFLSKPFTEIDLLREIDLVLSHEQTSVPE